MYEMNQIRYLTKCTNITKNNKSGALLQALKHYNNIVTLLTKIEIHIQRNVFFTDILKLFFQSCTDILP